MAVVPSHDGLLLIDTLGSFLEGDHVLVCLLSGVDPRFSTLGMARIGGIALCIYSSGR